MPRAAPTIIRTSLSGGMRQRVMIAMAIACKPQLLIADEPTTALDVTIQAQILELLRDLRKELSMSVMLISHDLGVIAEFAQRVVVMYAGRVVEDAPVAQLFRRPVHPYTVGLIAAVPKLDSDAPRLATIPGRIPSPQEVIPGCRFSPRCALVQDGCLDAQPPMLPAGDRQSARCPPPASCTGRAPWLISPAPSSKSATSCKTFAVKHAGGVSTLHALSGVNFDIMRGETLGLVGESGWGKTTAGRILVGLIPATSGTVSLFGHSITGADGRAQLASVRSRPQFVFQDPLCVAQSADADRQRHCRAARHRRLAFAQGPQRSGRGIARAGRAAAEQRRALPARILRRPAAAHRASRARSRSTRILSSATNRCRRSMSRCRRRSSICCSTCRTELGLSYLFIAHDLAVVRAVSTRVAVMYAGTIVETAPKAQIYSDPQHPYSRALLDAVPRADPDFVRHPVVAGEVPSLLDPPPGCRFHPRCAFAMERCRVEVPVLKESGTDRRVACHLFST